MNLHLPLSAPPRAFANAVAPHPKFADILRSAAGPLALFSAVLAFLLFLSWLLVLPRFTQVTVRGKLLSPAALAVHVRSVREELAAAQSKRDALILPLDQTSYAAFMQEKIDAVSPGQVRAAILGIAQSLVPEQRQAVLLTSFVFTPQEKTLQLSGDVRHVGLRSMTVLAQFVDAVSALPSVAGVQRPVFTREQDAEIGFHSPFTFRVTLQ